MKLRALKPTGKIYKVADQQGLSVAVMRTGVLSFRFDYRINGRRETLVIGQYDSSLGARKLRDAEELDYAMSLTLAEARLLLTQAHRSVERSESPSRAKVERRVEAAEALTFGRWAEKYFAEAALAESTRPCASRCMTGTRQWILDFKSTPLPVTTKGAAFVGTRSQARRHSASSRAPDGCGDSALLGHSH